MANLKVFVSSTCYDLHTVRGQLRSLLISLGYEPVMSEHADVIYDPKLHTHASCLREVENCDFIVVVIGSRFGGTTVPKALDLLDLDQVDQLSKAERFGEDKSKISITQAEVLQAIQIRLPVFAFVDSGVMRDHLTYEKNKNKSIINQIEFSSIEKADTASYIFEFINFLRLRNENNSIFEFSRFEDIEEQLKKQWSGLFQRLLHEQRTRSIEGRRIDNLSSQIADLKAAVIGSISSGELKETAKGAIRFRLMIEFLYSLASERQSDAISILQSERPWGDLIRTFGIIDIKPDANSSGFGLNTTILLRDDDTYYRVRASMRVIARLENEWEEYKKLGEGVKDAIFNAVIDGREGKPMLLVRHYNESFIKSKSISDDDNEMDNATQRDYLSTSRILLTQDKYIEESIKNFLVSEPSFSEMKFLVDVSNEKLNITQLPASLIGKTKELNYSINIPENGKLSDELSRLKALIRKDLVNTKDKKPIAAKVEKKKT